MGDDTLDPANETEAQLRAFLREFIEFGIRKPNEQFRYSRCNFCDLTWWDEREVHRPSCMVVKAKELLRRM